jgi:hypothetical protein
MIALVTVEVCGVYLQSGQHCRFGTDLIQKAERFSSRAGMIGKQQQSPEKSAADCVGRRSSLISDSSRKFERSVQDRPNGSDCASRRSLNRHCKLQITDIEKPCVKTIKKDAFCGFEE